MKQIIPIVLIFLIGCGYAEKGEEKIPEKKGQSKTTFLTDTILERTNPKSLDLTRHQLFIDTTRNSIFYENLRNWKLDEYNTKTVNLYIEELNKISEAKKVDFGNFPRLFVRVNQLGNEFFLYERCDGIDPRYELRDSAFIFYGSLESDAETIKKVHQINSQGIKLELNTFERKTSKRWSMLEVSKTKYEGIYSMKYQNENNKVEELIISITDIGKYDLVVNHCPKMKQNEFAPFY